MLRLSYEMSKESWKKEPRETSERPMEDLSQKDEDEKIFTSFR